MSHGLSIMNMPASAVTVEDIAQDYNPVPLGPRAVVIADILRAVPDADFSDPAWGVLNRPDFGIEFNMGPEEICEGVGLRVHGGDEALQFVDGLLKALGLRAIDYQTGDIFSLEASGQMFTEWQEFRDRAVSRPDGGAD